MGTGSPTPTTAAEGKAHQIIRESANLWVDAKKSAPIADRAIEALAAAGFAVVQLPEPGEDGAWRCGARSVWLDNRGPGGVRTLGDTWVEDPQAFAAALLAAARAVSSLPTTT